MTADTTAAAPAGVAAPGPGIYDIPAETYHADKVSLSSSGARKLLPPSCPAKFRWEQDHGQPFKREFEIGTAAHREVLGVGPDLVVVDADDWRTKDAKAKAAEARATGAVPLKPAEYAQIKAMAAALRAHPVASVLFAPGSGEPEKSLYWLDRRSGVVRRARPDWLPYPSSGRLIIPDYKTTRDASPGALAKAVYEHGYFQQGPWYMDGAAALGLADDVAFVFVFQEKTPPYLVHVVELDATATRYGRALNRQAIDKFAECTASGIWPGYGDDVTYLSLPPWAESKIEEQL